MLEGAIMKTKIIMTIDNLENIPYYKLPEGYSFRYFEKGDENIWSEIEFSRNSRLEDVIDSKGI